MTEPFEGAEEAPSGPARSGPATPTTAGGLIRAARERQGLHIAALATAIKVSPRKLDALENDRYSELPDATFTRALAQTVCKTLKLPAAPVLALLPAADASALDHVTGALNEPFRERPGREEHAALAAVAVRPMVWMGLAFLLAALVLFLAPATWWQRLTSPGAVADGATAASAGSAPLAASAAAPVPATAVTASDAAAALVQASASAAVPASTAPTLAVAPVPVPATVTAPTPAPLSGPQAKPTSAVAGLPVSTYPTGSAGQPAPPGTAAPAAAAANPSFTAANAAAPAPAGAAALQLQAVQATWAEVRDARGQVLVSRLVRAGEVVQMAGTPPLKLTLGNAPGTRLSFRGKAVDLVPFTRDSVARFELQ